MELQLDSNERMLLQEVVATYRDRLLHEIHRTDARDLRKTLQTREEVIEGLLRKLEGAS